MKYTSQFRKIDPLTGFMVQGHIYAFILKWLWDRRTEEKKKRNARAYNLYLSTKLISCIQVEVFRSFKIMRNRLCPNIQQVNINPIVGKRRISGNNECPLATLFWQSFWSDPSRFTASWGSMFHFYRKWAIIWTHAYTDTCVFCLIVRILLMRFQFCYYKEKLSKGFVVSHISCLIGWNELNSPIYNVQQLL